MKRWQIVGVGLFTLLLACSTLSHRQKADAFMAQGDYERAMRAYVFELQPRKVNGRRVINYTPEVVTRIGVSALHMDMTTTAEKVFRFVNRRSPDYGMATLYLGIAYEKMGDFDKADAVYGRYASIPESDVSRSLMKARQYWLNDRRMARQAEKLIAEAKLRNESASKYRVAVLDIQYDGFMEEGHAVSKALTTLLIEDLKKVDGLQVIDRALLRKVLEQLGLSFQEVRSSNRIVDLMRVLNVGSLVIGDLSLDSGDMMKVQQRLMAGSGVRGSTSETFSSNLQDFARLQKKMVFKVLQDIGISLNPALAKKIRQPATLNYNAFIGYGYGLHALDRHAYNHAEKQFEKALRSDALFDMAASYGFSAEAMELMRSRDFAELQTVMAAYFGFGGDMMGEMQVAGAMRVSSRNRLKDMGVFLDAGFIPGADTRIALEDVENLNALFPDGTGEPPDLRLPVPPELPKPVDVWLLPDPPATPHR